MSRLSAEDTRKHDEAVAEFNRRRGIIESATATQRLEDLSHAARLIAKFTDDLIKAARKSYTGGGSASITAAVPRKIKERLSNVGQLEALMQMHRPDTFKFTERHSGKTRYFYANTSVSIELTM
jgi:hypothetical protein